MSSSMMAASQVAFEPRDFMHAENYPSMDDHDDHHVPVPNTDTFADHTHQVVSNDLADSVVNYDDTGVPGFDGAHDELGIDSPPPPPLPQNHVNNVQATSPPTGEHLQPAPKIKSAKPERVVTKNADGKYVCTRDDCDEPKRTFDRRCEWSKHMDKHERPYPCLEDGCEKLPGFTYAGGLLRHEREVHGKHGGPKKPLTCPHPTCKRFAGKPFSRQENLNEHLRRVHTMDISDGQQQAIDNDPDNVASPGKLPSPRTGQRRKRGDDDDDVEALRQENKRLRHENQELRRQLEEITAQQIMSQQPLQLPMNQATGMNFGSDTLL